MTGYCNKCGETACSNKECESDIEAMAERKRFEDWHDNLFDVCAGTAVKTEYGYPQNGAIQMRWQAWQAALAAPPVERLRAELEDTQANYSGAMADLDALVDAFYAACPDNYFLNANYPRGGSSEIAACRDRALAEVERLESENANLKECLSHYQTGYFDKPKHIIEIQGELTQDQFDRIKSQCDKQFGEHRVLLLEGGMRYCGMTHEQALQDKE